MSLSYDSDNGYSINSSLSNEDVESEILSSNEDEIIINRDMDLGKDHSSDDEKEIIQEGKTREEQIAKLFKNFGLESTQLDDIENESSTFFNGRVVTLAKPDINAINDAKTSLTDCNTNFTGVQEQPMQLLRHCDERIQQLLKLIFQGFIWYYNNNNEATNKNSKYITNVINMVREEQISYYIEFQFLLDYDPKFVDWLLNCPQIIFPILNCVITEIVQSLQSTIYLNKNINVRIINLPHTLQIRQIHVNNICKLISIEGICVRRTEKIPQLSVVYYKCTKCGNENNGPYTKDASNSKKEKQICTECQSTGIFTIVREKTLFKDYQKVTLQELISSVPSGDVPRQRIVLLCDDLVDTIRPGDEVVIVGIYRAFQDLALIAKTNFSLFSQCIVANSVQKRQEKQSSEMKTQDIEYIKLLSKNPKVREKILNSIAPSIWGHLHVKNAIAVSMFGGIAKKLQDQHMIRGDINVLIIGDPGMGKSQFLKYVQHVFPRTILTTGKGASAVGLTASIRRNQSTGEWTLEGGAFVLADEGICLIDEFDKMSEQDRVSIHEAMEQQTISISKAGIVATLKARCAVIAAANPFGGKYNASLSLVENVDLSDPILSRFDIIAIVQDQIFPYNDYNLAVHVLNSHIESHEDNNWKTDENREQMSSKNAKIDETLDEKGFPRWLLNDGLIPESFLSKYIVYARKWCKPKLNSSDESKIVNFYASLRQATSYTGGLAMTVRHLESIVRISMANAKMRLSQIVSRSDIDFAISSVLESFIQSQKYSISMALSKKFSAFRALANSPDELIEGLIMDNLSRQFKENLIMYEVNSSLSDLKNKMSVMDLLSLGKNLYGLPEVVIKQYMNKKSFNSKYAVKQIDGEMYVIPVLSND